MRGLSLDHGEPLRKSARQFAFLGRLIDMSRHEMLRLDTDLIEQGQTARRGRCENEIRTAGHQQLQVTLDHKTRYSVRYPLKRRRRRFLGNNPI